MDREKEVNELRALLREKEDENRSLRRQLDEKDRLILQAMTRSGGETPTLESLPTLENPRSFFQYHRERQQRENQQALVRGPDAPVTRLGSCWPTEEEQEKMMEGLSPSSRELVRDALNDPKFL